ncbi:MAG: ABC transporter ATP-binding protein [Deinococcota bacterium]
MPSKVSRGVSATIAAPELTLENLSYSYTLKDTHVLDDISLGFPAGKFTSILGPSGAGKSTLLEHLAGLLTPTSGRVLLDDQPLPPLGFAGYMPQRDCLLPWRTVLANVLLGAQIQHMNKAEAKKMALELLHDFGLGEVASAFPAQLSGGMRQRVALARTVMVSRNLLLLDEPLSALDALNRLSLQQWLSRTIGDLGATTVMITHDIREALLLSDQIVVLSARPATVVAVYEVPLAERPRDPAHLHDASMQRLEQRLLNHLLAAESGSG